MEQNKQRIVVKVGTSTLTHNSGALDLWSMEHLVRTLADLQGMGHEVILVSSGAIAVGTAKLGLSERPKELRMKQAAAAVGQCRMMHIYDKFFSEYNRSMAQILLTGDDVEDPERAEHLSNTFSALLEMGVIPVVNENDSVSSAEIETGRHKVLGDNDTLSAIVAELCRADLLVLLSDIDGLYDADPKTHPEAKLLHQVTELTPEILEMAGGAGLIRAVAKEASVPVIRTGEGVCHIYIDDEADLDMGASILFNAKCSRPSVCNAVECVLVHRDVAADFWKKALPLLDEKGVELRADPEALEILGTRAVPAEDSDWDAEYDDYILAVKTAGGMDEAIDFINTHGTQHSEAIITKNYFKAQHFLDHVDAAAVYVNASTRFTDGGEFGLGAEIGISTQKMHARGPMGLEELTSCKYVIYGEGQVR